MGPPSPAATLSGVRVIDLTRNLAGPFCTLALAELGADVVKVESLTGDDTRAWAPVRDGDTSAIFSAANRSKRSIALDLNSTAGVDIVRKLATCCDVLVESFRPGALDRRGLGYDDLGAANGRLIYCSISAFGHTGPRADEPGYDPVVQAATGIMSITGEANGPAVRLGVGAVDVGAGMWATIGILAALRSREASGHGCRIDTSLYETAAWWLGYHVAMYAATGETPQRHGSASPAIAPYESFTTADGELFVAAANDQMFERLCQALLLHELADDVRFADNMSRVANRNALHGLLESRLRQRDATDWEAKLLAAGIACSRVRSVADFVADRQTDALDLLTGERGETGIAIPVTLAGERPPVRRPPPALSEHGSEILHEIGLDERCVANLQRSGIVG